MTTALSNRAYVLLGALLAALLLAAALIVSARASGPAPLPENLSAEPQMCCSTDRPPFGP